MVKLILVAYWVCAAIIVVGALRRSARPPRLPMIERRS